MSEQLYRQEILYFDPMRHFIVCEAHEMLYPHNERQRLVPNLIKGGKENCVFCVRDMKADLAKLQKMKSDQKIV